MADGLNPVVDTSLGPAPMGATGVIGLMSDLAEMRNRQNANLLFQKQMQARGQMGEDAAVLSSQGLNDDQILERISKSPYAPFVAPEIGMFRQAGQARVGMEAQKLAMWHDGVSTMLQGFAATGGDRSQWPGVYKGLIAGMPPEVQAQTKDAVEGLITSMTAGLPAKGSDWTPEHQATFNTRLRNLGVAFGMPLDKAYAIAGGVAPQVSDVPSPSGATTKAIVSGGGPSGTSVTPLGTGPSTTQAEAQKIAGQQQAGLPPTETKLPGPKGEEIPAILSGGGNGAAATASPILMGGPPKPAGTPTSPGAPSPAPEPAKGPPNEATAVMGPSLASAEFLKKTGELGGDIQQEVNDNAKSLPTMAKRVDLMTQALGQFQAGGFADTREGLAKLAQGLRNAGIGDITDETIQKIANGSLPAQQVFQSLVSRAGVQTLKADAQGTGRVMRSEVDRYLEMMGDTQDPRALATIMSNLRYTLLVGYDQGQKFTQFKQALAKKDPSVEGLDVSDFPSVYNRDFDESKLVTPKGISLGEISPTGFKGGTGGAAKVTHRWNPATQSVEEIK